MFSYTLHVEELQGGCAVKQYVNTQGDARISFSVRAEALEFMVRVQRVLDEVIAQ